jgi:hypothetical protein
MSDPLLHAIVPSLSPFFLASGRDEAQAEEAALGTIQRMQASCGADPLSIAQFVAYGLASLNTLGLTMDKDLDTAIVLKLNNSATALSRCQLRLNKVLETPPVQKPTPQPAARPEPERVSPEEAAEIQAEAVKQVRIAKNLQAVASKLATDPEPNIDGQDLAEAAILTAETRGQPVKTGIRLTGDQRKITSAYTYACTAEDCIKDPDTYACGSRKEANFRARMLNTCSYEVLCGLPADLSALTDFDFTAMA